MKFAAMVSALTVVTILLRAQTPAAATKPGSVEGTVIDSATGEGIKKASVTLEIPPSREPSARKPLTTKTDANGRFQFTSVEPGMYTVSAKREAYMDTQGRWGSPTPFQVAEEQQVKDVVLKLVPLAVVSGHVLDENGDPIPQAQVTVLRYGYESGGKRLVPSAATQTNDLGEFEIINLGPNRYYFEVTGPRIGNVPPHTRWTRREEAYQITFYPNAREIADAAPTDVTPGAHVGGIDFRLRKVPAYHIHGRVAGRAGGEPHTFDRFTVNASGGRAGGIFQSGLEPDGSFDIGGVASGWYEVSYSRAVMGKSEISYPAQSVHVADADVNGVVFGERPEVEVSGSITVEGASPSTIFVYVALSPSKGAFSAGAGTAADGTFHIKSAPMEVCSLDLRSLPDGYYVKSIHFGEREVKDGQIDLTNGASGPLSIVLASDGGTVDGSVQTADGQPSAGSEVTVAPLEEFEGRSDLLKRATTDAAGHFHVKDVAPGDYKAYAWEIDLDQSTWSAEFRKLFDARSAAVTVGPKGAASVQLNVITADEMAKKRSTLP